MSLENYYCHRARGTRSAEWNGSVRNDGEDDETMQEKLRMLESMKDRCLRLDAPVERGVAVDPESKSCVLNRLEHIKLRL